MTTAEKINPEERASVEQTLKDLLRALELDVDLECEEEEGRLYFNVSGPDARVFQRREDNLKSVSLILQTYLEKKHPESDLEIRFDANRSMRDREKELRAMAFAAADDLKAEGDEVMLDSLNPYERRIVHMTLQGIEHVDTSSVGEGHYKRLCVRYVGPGQE